MWFNLLLILLILCLIQTESVEGFYYGSAFNPARGYFRQSLHWPIFSYGLGPYRLPWRTVRRFPYWRNLYRSPRWIYSANRTPFYKLPYNWRF